MTSHWSSLTLDSAWQIDDTGCASLLSIQFLLVSLYARNSSPNSPAQNWFPMLGEHGRKTQSANRRFGVLGSHRFPPSNITWFTNCFGKTHVSKLKALHICHQINLKSNIYWTQTQIAFLELGKMYVFKFEHIQTWWIIGQGSLSFNCQATQHSKDHTQQNSATGDFRAHGTKSSSLAHLMLPMFPEKYYVSSWVSVYLPLKQLFFAYILELSL